MLVVALVVASAGMAVAPVRAAPVATPRLAPRGAGPAQAVQAVQAVGLRRGQPLSISIMGARDGAVPLAPRVGASRSRVGGRGAALDAIACVGAGACYAVGDGGTIVATADGGRTWRGLPNPAVKTNDGLRGISCPAPSACYAVGGLGTILATTDGGRSWRAQHAPLDASTTALYSVSCPAAGACYAAGSSGTIVATTGAPAGAS